MGSGFGEPSCTPPQKFLRITSPTLGRRHEEKGGGGVGKEDAELRKIPDYFMKF